MNPRVQGLDPAVQDLREAGKVIDLCDGDSRFPQDRGGASGRDDLHSVVAQTYSKIDEASFGSSLCPIRAAGNCLSAVLRPEGHQATTSCLHPHNVKQAATATSSSRSIHSQLRVGPANFQ